MLLNLLRSRIRDDGPLTAAAFMESALYHPEHGYYTRAPYPSARPEDADVNLAATRMLGELLARQLASFARALGPPGSPFTVIDAGAGDGRLAHALLRGLHALDPQLCTHTHLHLVERSASARHAQRSTLTAWADSAIGGETLPDEFEGVVIARDLLSAMPAHLLSRSAGELREVHVDLAGDRLVAADRAPSSLLLSAHLPGGGAGLPEGVPIAVSPAALDWIGNVARRLQRGFILIVDTAAAGSEPASWLECPGDRAIAVDVDFAAVRRVAEQDGCVTARFTTQAAYLVALAGHLPSGFADEERRAFAMLTGPGQSTRVLLLVKNMDGGTGDT